METVNAVIEDAQISTADHGILSVWLRLDYGGSCQGFGGYSLMCLSDNKKLEEWQTGGNYAGVFIVRCMEIAGVHDWKDMKGRTIRVRKKGFGSPGIVTGKPLT